jgi:hypothetical protein
MERQPTGNDQRATVFEIAAAISIYSGIPNWMESRLTDLCRGSSTTLLHREVIIPGLAGGKTIVKGGRKDSEKGFFEPYRLACRLRTCGSGEFV